MTCARTKKLFIKPRSGLANMYIYGQAAIGHYGGLSSCIPTTAAVQDLKSKDGKPVVHKTRIRIGVPQTT